jgi:hypothetical protein
MRQCCSKYSWRAPAGWVSKSIGKRSSSSDPLTRASSVLVSQFDAFEHQQVFIRVVLFRQSFWRGFFLSVFLLSGARFNWCILGHDILDVFLLSTLTDAYSCPVKLTFSLFSHPDRSDSSRFPTRQPLTRCNAANLHGIVEENAAVR